MRNKIIAAAALCLCAAALWGQFSTAGALALLGSGYGLRFLAPLSAAQFAAAQDAAIQQGLDLTAWVQTTATAATPGGRSAGTTVLAYNGQAALCYGARYRHGTAPGAAQNDGCAVSDALARQLWGSDEATGQKLQLDGTPYIVTGVFAAGENLLLCPAGTQTGFTALQLGNLPRADPRGAAQRFVQAAALPEVSFYLPSATLAGVAAAGCWLPLVLVGVVLLAGGAMRLWRRGFGGQALLFVLALAAGAALPALFAVLPGWLIPSRWSDFSFWRTLSATAAATLRTLLTLPDTAPDTALKTMLLQYAACGAAALAALAVAGCAQPPQNKQK